MSILIKENKEEIVVRKSPKDVAGRLVSTTRKAYQILINVFNETSVLFWANPQEFTPQQIADALGEHGKELFEIHGKLGEFLASFDQEAINFGLSLVKNFEFLEDGSVRVIESETDNVPSVEDAPAETDNTPNTEANPSN